MKKFGLTGNQLKLLAVITMTIDHVGAHLFPSVMWLRIIGRLAFPIYCFLLVEGVCRTRNPKKYGLRLLIGMLLSEIPYDLAFYGRVNWQEQSVMVTLLLGFVMLEIMKKCPKHLLKLLEVLPFAFAAEKLGSDYGAMGILVIAVFAFTQNLKYKHLWQFLGIWFIFSPNHLMMLNWLGGIHWTIQELAVFAVVPIALYSGKKATNSKLLQWVFYLFYPAHLLILYLIQTM